MYESAYNDLARAMTDARAPIERICGEVWNHAEVSQQEFSSENIHLRELEAAGFTITSRETSGRATAFIAEWSCGPGGPAIGFLPEYDALPGLGNAAVPRKEPAPNGNTNGHGCGHNLLGAGCTGAAIATKATMEARDIAGTVRVYGCAAEETWGAKVWMARDGAFDDLDACLTWHPAPIATTGLTRTTATNDTHVEFFGRTAHAGIDPWNGRSALDGLELFAHGINLMREHVEPTARMHYIFEEAGEAPNIVPDYARVYFRVRDVDRAHVEATTRWARELADGAALGTQTTAKFTVDFGLYDFLPNDPLGKRLYAHLQAVGVPTWTEDEQAFARECQKQMGVPEYGMTTTIAPYLPDTIVGGSSDVGDVSWCTPTMNLLYPTFPLGISLHTWPVTATGGMSIGTRAALGAAEILARVGLDILTDETLRGDCRADFENRLAGRHYVSPLPEPSAALGEDSENLPRIPRFKDATDEMI